MRLDTVKPRDILHYPLAWTLAAVALIAGLGALGFRFGFGSIGPGLGLAMFGLAAWIITRALGQMRAQQTTIHPHRDPRVLLTGGVFAISRNPIYLGFVLIALGAVFWADAPLGLGVVIGLVTALNSRFIAEEERILANMFPKPFAAWCKTVPRWI
jgi:protein-S-isoprenylcysteine O-methyltransferase Ste14